MGGDAKNGAGIELIHAWGREKDHRKTEKEREVITKDFSAYGRPLEMVNSFKYLGRVILTTDDNWPVVAKNLSWANKIWSRILCILSREGAAPQVSGFFLKAMI